MSNTSPTEAMELIWPDLDPELEQWYCAKTLGDPHLDRILTLKDQTICVMGGCGQVGSHLLTQLYALNFPLERLYINDDLRLGLRENLPAPLRDTVDTRSHQDYAGNPTHRPDVLIFVGGRSSVPHFRNLHCVMEEMAMWRVILEWCAQENIRLMFASTSSLCKQRPSLENQKVWPGSLYELTKLLMEEMAIQQALCENLTVQICRFFSVYGVTERHKGNVGNLYTQLVWNAIAQKPFEVWGRTGVFAPGTQTRDTIFAAEVCRAMLYLLTFPAPQPQLDNIDSLTYNIGQGQPMSVCDMIEQVRALMPARLQPIITEGEVPSDIKHYVIHTWGDPQKLIQTGFQPSFTNHQQNLKFIVQALLTNLKGYWSGMDAIRAQL